MDIGCEEARVITLETVVDAQGEVTSAFDDDDLVERAAKLSAVPSSDYGLGLT